MCIFNRLKGFVIKDGVLLKYKRNKTTVTIPNGTIKIGHFAFAGCHKLCKISIPNSVVEIQTLAFSGCTEMRDENGLVIIQNTLFHCYYTDEVIVPESVNRIAQSAFSTCKDMKTVTIPSSVTRIDNYTFGSHPDVTIYAPSNTYAEQYAKENNISFVAI